MFENKLLVLKFETHPPCVTGYFRTLKSVTANNGSPSDMYSQRMAKCVFMVCILDSLVSASGGRLVSVPF